MATKQLELEKLRDELNRLRPNNATKHGTRPSSSTSTSISTPPRPGTSLGFSSTSSTRGTSTASGAASASTTPTRPGSVAPRMYSSYPAIPSPPRSSDSPPETPESLPPAPMPGLMTLPPSPVGTISRLIDITPESPPSTPTPTPTPTPLRTTSYASRNLSFASQASRSKTPGPVVHKRSTSSYASVPARPSTAMASRPQHERWIPSQIQSPPPPSRSARYSSRTSGFQVVEEAD